MASKLGDGSTDYGKKPAPSVARYGACFRPRLPGQPAPCQQDVKGLFAACRHQVERLNERVAAARYHARPPVSRLSDWDGQAVLDEMARRVQARLVAGAGEQGLLLGEGGWEKAGTQSGGVAHQDSGQVGRWARVATGRQGWLLYAAAAARRLWWAGSSTCRR